MKPKILTKTEFGKSLNLTGGRVTQLIGMGLPVRPDGRIDVKAASRWYKANVARPMAKDEPAGSAAVETTDTFSEARRRREWQRLLREEIELKRLTGELVDAAAAAERWGTIAQTVREGFLSLPERMAPELAALTDPLQVRDALAKEFRIVLENLPVKIHENIHRAERKPEAAG